MKSLRKISMILAACLAVTGTVSMLPSVPTAQAAVSTASVTTFDPPPARTFVKDDAEIVIYEIFDDHAEAWGLSDSKYAGKITILPEINGLPVTAISEKAFYGFEYVTGFSIPDSVTKIGALAFFNCSGLESITIPDSVTEIANEAFSSCLNLTDVTFGDNLKTVGSNVFYRTPWLKAQKFLIVDHKLIDGKAAAGDIVIPDGVTEIADNAFLNNTELTGITIPDGVTIIGGSAFQGCGNLEQAVLPKDLTIISEGTFSGCTALRSVTIPNGMTEIRTSAFSDCTSLTSVTIPDSVTSIWWNAFASCKELAEITIPENVTYIGTGAFGGTKWLENRKKENPLVIVNHILIDGRAAEGDVVIPEGVTVICDWAFSPLRVDGVEIESKLTGITIPDSVTVIGSYAFEYCRNLKTVTLSENLRTIEPATFFMCSSLDHVTVPASVREISFYAFSECTSLKDITILNPDCRIEDNAFYISEDWKVPVMGDANGDFKVDISDVVLICRYAVQDREAVITDEGREYGDVTHDGKLDMDDAEKLLNYIAKKLTDDDLLPLIEYDPDYDSSHNPHFSEVHHNG